MNFLVPCLAAMLLRCRDAPAPEAPPRPSPPAKRAAPPAAAFLTAHESMVRDQIEARGVRDPLTLAAIGMRVRCGEASPRDVYFAQAY